MSNINGIPIFPVDEIIFERNIREDHDFAYITLHIERKERFETNDLVDINGNEEYIVQSDLVTQINEELYEHRISLYENLAFFDKIIPSERVFSKVNIVNDQLELMTIGEIFEHYKRELDFYDNIQIDLKDDGTGYENVQVPLKEFSGGVNFTSIMFELFRRIKANPKVERVNGVWSFFPQYWYTRKNDISNEIQSLESNVSFNNAEDYATQVKSLIKNGSNELIENVVFPSENGFIFPKSSSVQPRQSQLRYEVDSPILLVTKVVAFDVEFSNANFQNITLPEVDISDHVVTTDEFNALLPGTNNPAGWYFSGVNKRNAIQYQIGSRFITNLFTSQTDTIFGIFQTDTRHLRNALTAVATPTLAAMAPGAATEWPTAEDEYEIKVKIEYVRERNLSISSHRQLQSNMNESSVIHSQRDSRVEANRYKNNLNILSNRMGNTERTVIIQKEQGESLIEIFDYVGNELVIEVKNSIVGLTVIQEIKLSENFANANSEYAISRRLDPFTIVEKKVTTNVIYNDFVFVDRFKLEPNTILTEDGKENFLKTFNSDTTAKPIQASAFRDVDPFGRGLHMPVMKLTGGNLTFHAFFDRPNVAGLDFTGQFGSPILYTNQEGIVDDFNWFLIPDQDVQDTKKYPDLGLDYEQFRNFAYTDSFLEFPINLDPQASLAITYQINPISYNKNIIIYEGFSEFNYLIKVQSLDFKIYGKNKPYTYNDFDLGNEIIGSTFMFDINDRRMTFLSPISFSHFALVANDELVIAFNEPIEVGKEKIYFINFLDIKTKKFKTLELEPVKLSLKTSIDFFDNTIVANVNSQLTLGSIINFNEIPTQATNVNSQLSLGSIINFIDIPSQPTNVNSQLTLGSIINFNDIQTQATNLQSSLNLSSSINFGELPSQQINVNSELSLSSSISTDSILIVSEQINVNSQLSLSSSISTDSIPIVSEQINVNSQLSLGSIVNFSSQPISPPTFTVRVIRTSPTFAFTTPVIWEILAPSYSQSGQANVVSNTFTTLRTDAPENAVFSAIAPSSFVFNGITYTFVQWIVNGIGQPFGEEFLDNYVIISDTDAEIVYIGFGGF